MQQCGAILSQLITGKEGDTLIGHLGHPREQQIGAGLGAFADDKGQHQAPHRRKGKPNPGISVRLTHEFGRDQIVLFGMYKAPQLIQLAFGHGQPLPQVEHDQPALHRCTVQPGTSSIFIDLDDPPGGTQGIAFSQRTDRRVEKRWRGVQFKRGRAGIQGNAPSTCTAPRLFLPTRRAIFDQQSLVKWAPVTRAAAIRTVECVPVQSILPALLNIRHSAEDTRSRVRQSILSR